MFENTMAVTVLDPVTLWMFNNGYGHIVIAFQFLFAIAALFAVGFIWRKVWMNMRRM